MARPHSDPPATAPRVPSQVLSPDWVIGPDGVHYGWSVAICGGRITHAGPRDEVLAQAGTGLERRLPRRGIVPGLVDCHTHLSESFAKSLTFYEPAQLWRRLWLPLEMALTPEETRLATLLACWESLRGGFTTSVESGCKKTEGSEAMLDAILTAGNRCVYSCEVFDRAPPVVTGPRSPR